jgi:hypothetical protein
LRETEAILIEETGRNLGVLSARKFKSGLIYIGFDISKSMDNIKTFEASPTINTCWILYKKVS